MKKIKENIKLFSALLWIAVSVCSLFVSVISYTDLSGVKTVYALQDLLDGTRFSDEVLANYTGDFYVAIGNWVIVLLCMIAVAAIAASFVGIIILSNQKPVKWPFVMTVLGIIGTAIPSIMVLVAVILSISYFDGTISCGAYPIVTPIAMAVCLFIVAAERRKYLEKVNAEKNSGGLIRPAGDL